MKSALSILAEESRRRGITYLHVADNNDWFLGDWRTIYTGLLMCLRADCIQ